MDPLIVDFCEFLSIFGNEALALRYAEAAEFHADVAAHGIAHARERQRQHGRRRGYAPEVPADAPKERTP